MCVCVFLLFTGRPDRAEETAHICLALNFRFQSLCLRAMQDLHRRTKQVHQYTVTHIHTHTHTSIQSVRASASQPGLCSNWVYYPVQEAMSNISMVGWAETATKDGLTVLCLCTCMCLHVFMCMHVNERIPPMLCVCMHYNAGELV